MLVVQHEAECPPGWVGQWLTEAGVRLDVRRPYAGEPLPANLEDHAGLVVLGGHMGANDDADFPWLAETKALIRRGASDGVPTLGICLGHQLAAVALGGAVVVNPAGQRRGVLDMGWLPDAADDALLGECGRSAVQWHHDMVSALPPEARALARADTGELLAARFAPTVWGVQCHPEAGADLVATWAAEDQAQAGTEGEALAVAADLAHVEAAADELRQGWRPLATRFAALVTA